MTRLLLISALLAGFALAGNSQAETAPRQPVAPAYNADLVLTGDAAKIRDRMAAVWRKWSLRNKSVPSAMVIAYRGDIVFRGAVGAKISDPSNLASLSKSIMAVCFARVMADHGLSFSTTLSELRATLLEVGIFLPDYAERIELGQLITHASGLNPDITQGDTTLAKGRLHLKTPEDLETSRRALEVLAVSGRRGQHFYNNGNYALIGALMQGLLDEPYESYCRRRVLSPAGAEGLRLEGEWAGAGAWGGWNGAPEDFLRFALHYFGHETAYGSRPDTLPFAQMWRDAYYGLGMEYYGSRAPWFISHHGTMCSESGFHNISTIFFLNETGWSVALNARTCLGEQHQRLHDALERAAKR